MPDAGKAGACLASRGGKVLFQDTEAQKTGGRIVLIAGLEPSCDADTEHEGSEAPQSPNRWRG
jgi:hypothetical protein